MASQRERIAEIKADIHTVQSAAIPSKIVKARLRAEIKALAGRGALDVGPCIEIGAPLQWPMQPVRGEIFGMTADGSAGGFTQHEIPDALALFCWLA